MGDSKKTFWEIIKEWAPIFLALSALVVSIVSSIVTSNKADQSNVTANKALENSKVFGEINAEVQWDTLLDSYYEVDGEIRDWEKTRDFKGERIEVVGYEELEKTVAKLNAPDRIKRLYIRRYHKYESLKNVAKRYEPVDERLNRVDFSLPAAPKLPKVTMKGVSISGGGSMGN